MSDVFARLLGDDFVLLHPSVRRFHAGQPTLWRGDARSGGSNSILSRAIRRVFGFPVLSCPVLSDRLEVEVRLQSDENGDRWNRRFGDRRFASSFHVARDGKRLQERFAPFRFSFTLRAEDTRMVWDSSGWSFGPMPLPKFLGPRILTWEDGTPDGGFHFYSQADFPLIRRLVEYEGRIYPMHDRADQTSAA